MALDTITRREKLLAKLCWPKINTQRTRFLLLNTEAGFCDLPDYGDVKAVYYAADNADKPVAIEHVKVSKWIANGKRRSVVARWGYSSRLDTVVIRDVTIGKRAG